MNYLSKMIACTAVVGMVGLGLAKAEAEQYASSTGGCGYAECRRAPCLAPAIALGTIALIAIIAVAVHNRNGGSSSHSHSGSSTDCP